MPSSVNRSPSPVMVRSSLLPGADPGGHGAPLLRPTEPTTARGAGVGRRTPNVSGVSWTDYPVVLVVLDLLGIFVFALAGALVGVRRDLDVFGVLVLAGTTGLGGGFVRDVLIDATPPAALTDWRYLLVPVFAGLLTFVAHPAVGRFERPIGVLDAFGLSLFCVAGALKAAEYGLGPVPAALMGMVTAVGGGMVRDVLVGQTPQVFADATLYATPALGGAAVAVVGLELGAAAIVVAPVGALVCLTWRLLAIWRQWQAPRPRGPASV